MPPKARLFDLFEGHRHQKLVLLISVLVFLMLELLIYLGAASQAGQKSFVVITGEDGKTVYETTGSSLTSYEKMVFENTFGPLQNYRIHVNTQFNPFPFRAWMSAAVGIPIGLVLLLAFVVRAFLSLLYGEEKPEDVGLSQSSPGAKGRLGSLFHFFGRVSVFHIGFLIVVSVVLLWLIPNFLGDFARVSMSTIREFKWFFLGVGTFLGLLILWVVYLRYQLSKRMLDNQLDLEKYRVERQLLIHEQQALLAAPVEKMPEEADSGQYTGMS
jgi:hypothetical protein